MIPQKIRTKDKIPQAKLYIALIIITFTFIIAASEIMARYFVKENRLPAPPPHSKIDPYSANPYMLGMRPFMHFHIPNSHYTQSRSYYAVDYTINSSAFRGPEIKPKSKDIKRAIIIGDSIVEGHGCEFKETFAYRLDEKAKPFNWEVLNLGVQGACPSYFAANIDRYLAAEPDAAFIVMFENDLYDDRIQEKTYFDKPILDNPSQMYERGNNVKLSVLKASKFYTLIQRAFYQLRKNEFEAILRQNSAIDIHNDEQNSLDKMSPWLVAPSMFDKQWDMTTKYLDFTLTKFREQNIPIHLVFLSLGAVAPGQNPAYQNHAEMLNSRVQKWAESNSFPFLSLMPVIKDLMDKVPPSDIMIADDGHPTPKTHQIICDNIWKWIIEEKK